MAGEWTTVRLGELCDFRAGSVFKPSLQGQSSGSFPFVKVSDMNLSANAVRIQDANNWVSEDDLVELRAKPFPPGTVVFAKIGEALRQNRLRQVARETIVDNNMMGAVPRTDRIDPRFFYYALSKFDFSDIAQGTALPYLTVASLAALNLEVPPADEQRAIAHILGTLDDKIELNRRMSETLEAMARALFKSWFVDFDPVRAKAEGRDPGLPQPLADLFPARLVDSELAEIPEGWGVGTLADLASLNPEVWTKGTRPSKINYVDLSNAKWGRIEAVPTYAASNAPSRAQRVLRPGDTIVGTVRPGNGSYALVSEPGLTGSTGFAVLRPNKPTYVEFVYLAATAADNIDTLAHLADGAAYPAVRPDVIAATPIVRPDNEMFDRFSRVVGPLLAKIAQHARESRTLAALRDALLPKLISGELRVMDADRFIARLSA
jgi:type I restriction enzyme S subunit